VGGVVDEQVDAAEFGHRLSMTLRQWVASWMSPGMRTAFRPAASMALGLVCIVMLVEIRDEDVRSLTMATARPIPLSAPVIMASFSFRGPEPL
jgi:hypothetical protein